MSNKRKHSVCSLKDKLDVLARLDKGESATKLAAEFGIGKATITDWKKNRSKIEQFSSTTSESMLKKRKTLKVSHYEKIDEALYLWFSQERQKGIPISGPIIQEKAHQLNTLMDGDPTFVASNGWLDRWKKRHGVRQLCITGEKLSSDYNAAEEFIKEFNDLISSENYLPQQVYNCDESGLNFKALPQKSLASQEEACAPGFKMSKERVTVLVCSNATGDNKLPLMFIGKSKNPRALKNVNMNSLPVFYRNQKKAWMTTQLFKEWFEKQFVPAVEKFNKDNSLPNCALLILDNAPSHPAATSLCCGSIKAVFLPPNVTALLQPMDQGVLQNVKLSYRKRLLRKLCESDSSSVSVRQLMQNVTIKDVIYWVSESWDNVTQNCLLKSWKKLWPSLTDSSDIEQGETNKSEILPLIKCIPGCEDATEQSVTEWLSCDTEGTQIYTDEEIISLVQNNPQDDSELEESDEPVNVLVSHSEAANALEIALRYIEQSENATTDILFIRRWYNIASLSRITSLRQTNLTNFFSPKDR